MKRIVVFALLVLMLPVAQGFAEMANTPSSLGVRLTGSTFSYKDDAGYTVVLGEMENTKNFPVTNVKIWVGFYSKDALNTGLPLETVTGTTLLNAIQPHEKSPFMIKSQTANPEISQVTVNMLGFNSATAKPQLLEITPATLSISNVVKLPGTITNKGQQPGAHAQIHLISYDAFNPPRIVGIQTIPIDDLEPNTAYDFNFETKADPRVTSYKVVAESDNYQSKIIDVTKISVDIMTRLITINDIQVVNSSGEKISKIKVGTPVDITSMLSIQAVNNTSQPYVYYAQVKQFGEKGTVEFLGLAEGIFNSTQMQSPKVAWTPQNEGGFFIETYVWDPSGAALATQSSTVSLILVMP